MCLEERKQACWSKMAKQTKTTRLLKQLKGKQYEPKTPIASEMFVPNLSGDHSAGIVNRTPTQDTDLVNKKYVDDSIAAENLWDRAGTLLSPHTAGDDVEAEDMYVAEYIYHTGDTDTNIQFVDEGIIFSINGTELWRIIFSGGKYHIIFNEDGNALHFRAEGGTNPNLFYLNGALDCVGIGKTPAPGKILDVNGSLMAIDYYSGDGSQGIDQVVAIMDRAGLTHTMTFKDGLLTAYSTA